MRIADHVVAQLGDAVVSVERGFGPTTVDVDSGSWLPALAAARDGGAGFFDLLTAYDLGADGFAVVVHLAAVGPSDQAELDHVLLRTTVAGESPTLPSATEVYAGAAWHERETHEMFAIDFTGHPGLTPLLLSPAAPSAPLRKDTVLAARAARPWPGEKDPADSTGRARRRSLPPGVPADWPSPEAGS
jgi:NADH:ubiquinone oxidoreductase subunit C